jgi:hypothetical protein
MRRVAQSTSYVVMLKVFLSNDHVTAATGKTVAITISKAGGAFGNPNAGATNATEVSSGWYKVTMDTTDTGTLGDLVVRGTATACDDTEQVIQITDDPTTLLDRTAGVETGMTLRQALRLMSAAILGKASGMETTTAVFRDVNDSKNRISATVDVDGNRTAVTLDAT